MPKSGAAHFKKAEIGRSQRRATRTNDLTKKKNNFFFFCEEQQMGID